MTFFADGRTVQGSELAEQFNIRAALKREAEAECKKYGHDWEDHRAHDERIWGVVEHFHTHCRRCGMLWHN